MTYLAIKFAHVCIAIVAIGSGAALSVVLAVMADDPAHGLFASRWVRRLLWLIVVPGYVLMLVTGMWMGHLADLLDAHWAEMAMNLWGFGAIFIGLTIWSVGRQIAALGAGGPASPAFRRAALFGRMFAVGWALVVVSILFFMVFKPI